MLDFSNILNNPNIDVQTFIGPATASSAPEWRTWRKPRGAKFIYMIGVGSGSSGGCGLNSATTSGGGAGGPSGAQTVVMIPAMFVPDVLYVQTGAGGQQPAVLVSGALNVAGVASYVCISPYTSVTAAGTILFANGGQTGTAAATSTTGGTASTAAIAATINNMPLAGRGFYQFFAGQAGTAGGTSSAGSLSSVAQTYPTTGLMVQGGQGGVGYTSVTSSGNNSSTGAGFGDNFPSVVGASTADGTGDGSSGTMIKPFQYTGGTGGVAQRGGGIGAPGCGGGGAGGSSTGLPTLARPGDGGPGFVYIFTM